ncbi:zinc finger matrin-type protein CG9776 isoform X2 [Bicyclus anynana]|uniref:Zinc finger matrin-type protein CG9776 isoform X2 n=1 Tax=Bicyclus anynana TaxID=110368 RepID=A0ABM3LGE9_BICAN|nr:zinc finger matrin-type protein CG9776 isoform X2 [Bicyclus anynana]
MAAPRPSQRFCFPAIAVQRPVFANNFLQLECTVQHAEMYTKLKGSYSSNYQPSYSGVYDDFPSVASIPPPQLSDNMSTWNQMSLPPPPTPPVYNIEDQIKKEAAIETELRHQKAALSKQREDYIKKTAILKKELDTLKDQRNELRGDTKRSPSPDTKRFLKENTKLQLEIQNKLKTINNVVDMLNGIIGEQAPDIVDRDETPERSTKRKSRSPSSGKKFNYVYYDPEMHWCRVCNDFPSTAKDYLNHLHSPAHHKMAAQHMEAPWHSMTGVNEGFPSYPSAPTKRTPIRGLQFFVPSTAWYCKLCDQFIGDLHCASAHLKSLTHSKNYINFVEQNPHWETDWMSDRQKAFEKARATNKVKLEDKPHYTAHTITFSKDGFHTKSKIESPPPPVESKKKKEKKKKFKRKRSSSISSSSSSSGSYSEPKKKKKSKKRKSSEKLTEWMSSIQMERLNESDRKLLDNIKSRIRQDKEEKRHAEATEVIDLSRSSRDRDNRARDRNSRGRSRPREERGSRARERESRPRDSRSREERDKREEPRRRDDRKDDRREDRRKEDRRDEDRRNEDKDRRSPVQSETKKVDNVRKMPFIGKMPVFKSLSKNSKSEETKKEEKRKEDEEAKKRQEIDAEIQKKVAEFKEKIAKAQLERQRAELPPPQLLLPLPHFLPPAPAPPAPPPAPPVSTPQPPAPALPKDFQEALDIIFPSADQHTDMGQQDIFPGMSGLGPPGFPGIPGLMNPFPQMSLLGQPPPHLMMGFDMNNPLFGPRPQLYDTHVPLVPKPRPNNKNKHNGPDNRIMQNKNYNNRNNNNANNKATNKPNNTIVKSKPANATMQGTTTTANTSSATSTTNATKTAVASAADKNKEEMDDLAMLGIDASDVGAGI